MSGIVPLVSNCQWQEGAAYPRDVFRELTEWVNKNQNRILEDREVYEQLCTLLNQQDISSLLQDCHIGAEDSQELVEENRQDAALMTRVDCIKEDLRQAWEALLPSLKSAASNLTQPLLEFQKTWQPFENLITDMENLCANMEISLNQKKQHVNTRIQNACSFRVRRSEVEQSEWIHELFSIARAAENVWVCSKCFYDFGSWKAAFARTTLARFEQLKDQISRTYFQNKQRIIQAAKERAAKELEEQRKATAEHTLAFKEQITKPYKKGAQGDPDNPW